MKLIAGVDPGTTVGWAVFDLSGKVVAVGSQKEFGVDALVAKLRPFGKIIAVGTDKAKIPSFAQEIATKFGAKMFGPSQDLRVDEKRAMVSELNFKNSHEMDALASSLVAYKKMQPLLTKIHSFLARKNQLNLFETVVEIVLKEGISIHAAITILTPKEEAPVIEVKEEKRDEDIVRLYRALSRARKETVIFSNRLKELESKLYSYKQELYALKERTSGLVKPKTPAEISRLKESRIISLSQRLENSKKVHENLKGQISELEHAMLKQDIIALPRLPRLGWDEVMRNKEFIQEGTVLFVDDANQMSGKAIEFLHKRGVQLIICNKLPSQRASLHLPFACVQALEYEAINSVVLVKKSWLNKVRAERLVLAKVVQEYKKQRSTA